MHIYVEKERKRTFEMSTERNETKFRMCPLSDYRLYCTVSKRNHLDLVKQLIIHQRTKDTHAIT